MTKTVGAMRHSRLAAELLARLRSGYHKQLVRWFIGGHWQKVALSRA